MRKELAKIKEVRKRFTGVFSHVGQKRGWKGASEKTIMIRDIKEVGTTNILTDHVWFTFTSAFADVGFLKTGDVLEFDARVKPYQKGYVGNPAKKNERPTDYKLSHPTKVVKTVMS